MVKFRLKQRGIPEIDMWLAEGIFSGFWVLQGRLVMVK